MRAANPGSVLRAGRTRHVRGWRRADGRAGAAADPDRRPLL